MYSIRSTDVLPSRPIGKWTAGGYTFTNCRHGAVVRPIHLVTACILGWSLACGFFESADAPHFTDQVAITEPWSDMALPVEGAKVTFSDSETFTVHHGDTPIPKLGEGYKSALTAAGWKLDRDDSIEGLINQTWTKGDDIISLAVLDQAGEHVATVAIVPF